MPGRVSSGPAKVQKPKAQRRRKNRALDAFTIAEREQSEKNGLRKHRYGELEGPKRPHREAENESESEEGERRPKRPRHGDVDATGAEIDGGSDSEGNEWLTGRVPSDEDSEIDSDEAFGESDEETFAGFNFRGSTSKKPRRKAINTSHDLDEGDEEDGFEGFEDYDEDSEAESEGFAAEAIDPAAVLDQRDSESEPEPDPSRPKKRTKSLLTTSRIEEDQSLLPMSEDELDDQDEANYQSLQNFVSGLGNSTSDQKSNGRSKLDVHEALTPSEYGITTQQKLTIEDLLPTVIDPKARKALRALAADSAKPSRPGSGIPGKLSVPLAKRQQDRIDRTAAYDQSKETLKRWIETVKQNRQAEHLHFPLVDPDTASAQNNKKIGDVTNFKPVTDLETTIQSILEESGMSAKNGKTQDDYVQEMEELETRHMPIEEVRKRRAELRRARELLFREEIKARRIKKIKSKSYRRVHRKERQRKGLSEAAALADAGAEPDEEELERLHRLRAEERMGARHRSSKWAKAMKATGRATWDNDARAGMQDMARREEALIKTVAGKSLNADGEEASSESEGDVDSEDENDEAYARRMGDKLDSLEYDQDGPESRLASLPFMQKAEAARKARNNEDIKQIRQMLAGEDDGSEHSSDQEEGEGTIGRLKFGPVDLALTSKAGPEPRNEFEEPDDDEDRPANQFLDEDEPAIQAQSISRPQAKEPHRRLEKPSQKKHSSKHPAPEPSSVLVTLNNLAVSKPVDPAVQAIKDTKTTISPPKPPSTALPLPAPSDTSSSANSDSDSESSPAPLAKSNAELIAETFADTFAGPDAAATSATFSAEKAALAASEAETALESQLDPPNPYANDLPGWGTWTGAGLSAKDKRRATQVHPHKAAAVAAAEKKKRELLQKRQDFGDSKVVISERRATKSAPYLADVLPHPFETRAQYERSLRVPVGQEWSSTKRFEEATKPRVLVKAGRVIAPIRKPLA